VSELAREQIAEFRAILACTPSMLRVSNEGVARVSFDIDEQELPKVLGILMGKDRVLRVRVEVE